MKPKVLVLWLRDLVSQTYVGEPSAFRHMVGAVLVLISVSLFASAETVYLNSDTVLNSAYISGNSSIGAFVINSSNITVNLAGSTLTRNLSWFDGSTLFSSNGFQNVTIKDGTLNWTDFGKVRPIGWYVDNRSYVFDIPDFTFVQVFFLYLVNGLDAPVYIINFTATGQCYTQNPSTQTYVEEAWTNPGNITFIYSSNRDLVGGPSGDIYSFLCTGNVNVSQPYNFFINITYNDSTNIRFIQGNLTGRFGENRTITFPETTMHILSQDFLLTNSNLKLINITYSGSKFFWTNFSDSASNLSVGWYLDVQVNDSGNNPIANANVTATDKNGVVRGLGTTDSNGRVRFSLPEYVQNSTGRDWKSNYTVTASYDSLSNITQINLTGNKDIYLSLNIDIIPPRITNYELIVQGENSTTANNVFISPNSSIGTKDGVRINVSASEIVNFSIRIYNSTGSPVTDEWKDNNKVQTIKPQTCYWNGTRETQCTTTYGYLPDGIYTINVRLRDGAGNTISNTTKTITIDSTLPQGINPQKNQTAIYKYNFVSFNATWTDANLSGYVFSINQNGSWVNSSFISFTGNLSNYTIQINASGRTVVYWKFYAQDLAGNWNSTDVQNFTVLQTLSIFIDRNSWDLGLIPRNTTQIMDSTTRINVTNDGDGNQSYNLRILNVTPNDWIPSSSIANNTFAMSGLFVNSSIIPSTDFFNNDSSSEDVIITSNKTANSTTFAWAGSSIGGYSVPSGISTFLWLRFDSPTSVSTKEQHTITIQIGVIAG